MTNIYYVILSVFGYLWQKVNFLYGNHDFCKQGVSTLNRGLSICWDPPPNNIDIEIWIVRSLGVTPLRETNPSLSLTNIVKFVDWLKEPVTYVEFDGFSATSLRDKIFGLANTEYVLVLDREGPC